MQQENENTHPNATSKKSARKWRVPAAAEESLRSLHHALSNSPSSTLPQATAQLSKVYENVHPSNRLDHVQGNFSFSRLALTTLHGNAFLSPESHHWDTLSNMHHIFPAEQQKYFHEHATETSKLVGVSVKRFFVDLTPAQESMLLRKANRYVNAPKNQLKETLLTNKLFQQLPLLRGRRKRSVPPLGSCISVWPPSSDVRRLASLMTQFSQ